jgi:hypothetical protein
MALSSQTGPHQRQQAQPQNITTSSTPPPCGEVGTSAAVLRCLHLRRKLEEGISPTGVNLIATITDQPVETLAN